MKNIMKKVIIVLTIVVMVLSMGAWTYGSDVSKIEETLRTFGFHRSEDDETIWVCDVMDYDASDYDYVIIHGTYWTEQNILTMNAVGIDSYRNLIVVIADGVAKWDSESEEFEEITTWAWEDYTF